MCSKLSHNLCKILMIYNSSTKKNYALSSWTIIIKAAEKRFIMKLTFSSIEGREGIQTFYPTTHPNKKVMKHIIGVVVTTRNMDQRNGVTTHDIYQRNGLEKH